MFVDVHTHLTHAEFSSDLPSVVQRCESARLGAVIVNGLEPVSNRRILDLAKQYPIIKPALGIYPVDAVNDLLPEGFSGRVGRFAVQDEIAFIEQQAAGNSIIAIGECGLDAHWVTDPKALRRQEEVFCRLVEIATNSGLPLIVHTRKAEQRAIDILAAMKVSKVNFHCFGGKPKMAAAACEKYGWWFSIPANAVRSESFQRMLKILPLEKILTETDAPYLGPEKGGRSEPADVVGTIKLLAKLRGLANEEAEHHVWQNYEALFLTNR